MYILHIILKYKRKIVHQYLKKNHSIILGRVEWHTTSRFELKCNLSCPENILFLSLPIWTSQISVPPDCYLSIVSEVLQLYMINIKCIFPATSCISISIVNKLDVEFSFNGKPKNCHEADNYYRKCIITSSNFRTTRWDKWRLIWSEPFHVCCNICSCLLAIFFVHCDYSLDVCYIW